MKNKTKKCIKELKKIYPTMKYDTHNKTKSKYNTTYGEMEYEGIEKLYNHLLQTNKQINCFMDLGSGRGKLCMYMSAQQDIQKVIGIELVKERHDDAIAMKNKLTEISDKVDLFNNDIFKISLIPYAKYNNFIWISSLCFSEKIVNNIFKKIKRELNTGTIVCCSKIPTIKIGELIDTVIIPQTWNSEHEVSIFRL
jgi:hypothetical protein